MTGYVAKDAKLGHPFTCGFPRSAFAVQDAFDPFDSGCGNGLRGGSAARRQADPRRRRQRAGRQPRLDRGADRALRVRRRRRRRPLRARQRAGALEQHPPRHPSVAGHLRGAVAEVARPRRRRQVRRPGREGDRLLRVGVAELLLQRRATSSTPAARRPPPTAPRTAARRWSSGTCSKMRDYEQANKKRLLDYIDVHYYRQGGNSADVTRSLWDPTYTDPSWINDKIRLLPRMKEWVANNYPGTKLALTEYNLSVPGDPRLNALIQADTLGIFAREGVDLATRWAMGRRRRPDRRRVPDLPQLRRPRARSSATPGCARRAPTSRSSPSTAPGAAATGATRSSSSTRPPPS